MFGLQKYNLVWLAGFEVPRPCRFGNRGPRQRSELGLAPVELGSLSKYRDEQLRWKVAVHCPGNFGNRAFLRGLLRCAENVFPKSGRNVIHHERRLLCNWLPTPTIYELHLL